MNIILVIAGGLLAFCISIWLETISIWLQLGFLLLLIILNIIVRKKNVMKNLVGLVNFCESSLVGYGLCTMMCQIIANPYMAVIVAILILILFHYIKYKSENE